MSQNPYILQVGSKDQKRLEAIHQAYFDPCEAILKRAGLKQGFTVVDAGCGPGFMTTWLAEKVGPHGQVIALDSSEQQLKLARDRVQHFGYKNVLFEQCDLSLKFEKRVHADIVYARFVLHHMIDKSQALSNLIKICRPGGSVIIGEPIFQQRWSKPYSEAFDQCFALCHQFYLCNELNPNYGEHLYNDMHDTKELIRLCAQTYQPVSSQLKIKQSVLDLFVSLEKNFYYTNLLTQQGYQYILGGLEEMVENKKQVVALPAMTLIWGRKKKG